MTRADIVRGAVRTALRHGTDRKEISVPHWAKTYRVPQSVVREIFADEMTKEPPSMDEGGSDK